MASRSLVLRWTPGLFAAQVRQRQRRYARALPTRWSAAGDGSATATRSIELVVRNVNQAPRLLPVPLQLVQEGQTLAFTMLAGDADSDPTQLAFVYDDDTPAGINFNATTGAFEWTPGADVVDNASGDSRAFNLRFSATDGTATTYRTVQVRVYDVNRPPQIVSSSHAVLVGQSFALPVVKGASAPAGALRVSDADGAAQTEALVVSFSNLPEGAAYDAAAGRLRWTPGPGQVGDFVVVAQASDGRNTTTQTFTLRVVAAAAANAPKVLINTTPATPVLPGQAVIATARAVSFGAIAGITAQVRGAAIGAADWTTVSLDSLGRLRVTPTGPGLVEIRVVAIDVDGFSTTQLQTIRVRDPLDASAPGLTWGGALEGSDAHREPAVIGTASLLQARIADLQLMGWQLEIAPANGGAIDGNAWRTIAGESDAAASVDHLVSLATLDPATLANGAYVLRLRASDLSGRTTEIEARILVDSASKTLTQAIASDAIFRLGDHDLALTRILDTTPSGSEDVGNWSLPWLDAHLTTDQDSLTPLGAAAPWLEGARIWLQVPASLGQPEAATQYLRFTLSTQSVALSSQPGAPIAYRPIFAASGGWTLRADDGDERQAPSLQRQGQRLFSQDSGLAWVPQGFVLTGPDGTRYRLDATGKVESIAFTDGQQWLVSDAGVALVGADDPAARVEFVRDAQGRIDRVSGPAASGDATSVAYRYDAQGRLVLARSLFSAGAGTFLGYHEDGTLIDETITASLGTAVGWLAGATAPSDSWAGTLVAGEPAHLAFSIRESELASTVKTPGAQGAVIVAVEVEGAGVQLSAVGATILGQATSGARTVTLLRTTEAGLKLLTLQGAGSVSVRISLAGDIDRDGDVDGSDSAAWEAAAAQGLPSADFNGDGIDDPSDRQVLYANYGWHANLAPVAAPAAQAALRTHADLAASHDVDRFAIDGEGDAVFWSVIGSTHGSARLLADGKTLLFVPSDRFVGRAEIVLRADDGYSQSQPIAIQVDVSGARLLMIHLEVTGSLKAGASTTVRATGDFEDEAGVDLSGSGDYLKISLADLSASGYAGEPSLVVDDARDLLRGVRRGPALVDVIRVDLDGRLVRAVAAVNVESPDSHRVLAPFVVEPDVYPGTLALQPGGSRQIKVHLTDPFIGESVDIHSQQPSGESGTRYFSSDESVATVSLDGTITALRVGHAAIYVVHVASQRDELGRPVEQVIGQSTIDLTVAETRLTDDDAGTPAPQRIVVVAGAAAAVADATGETVLIGADALRSDTAVGIRRIDLADLSTRTGLAAPAAGVLKPVAAFTLDIGDSAASHPLQLAIPIQPGTGAVEGDEVLIFRKGEIPSPTGGTVPTWWLVDNGVIGSDGIARTASPPYSGVVASGEYVVAARLPGVVGSAFDLGIGAGEWVAFAGLGFAIAGGLSGVGIASEIVGILMTSAGSLSAGSYRFGVPQFASIPLPQVAPGETYRLDVDAMLPPLATPWGNVVLPNLETASIDEATGELVFEVANSAPGVFSGTIVVRALFGDRTFRDIATVDGGFAGSLRVTPPADLAIASAVWQLVRLVPTSVITGSGLSSGADPLEFGGNAVQILPQTDLAAVLTRTGVDFYREDKVVGHTNLLQHLGERDDFGGLYLGGRKAAPIAFSADSSRAYVAGNGVIYVVDMVSFRQISTIVIPAGKNISSLASVGDLLLVGEGQTFGSGASQSRLLAVNINPSTIDYNRIVTVRGVGVEASPLGVGGITVGPDGRTVIVSLPRISDIASFGLAAGAGDLVVLDLATLNRRTGSIAAPTFAALPPNGGKAVGLVSATDDPNRFLVASPADYNRGLATLVISRGAGGAVSGATMSAISLFQPGANVKVDRLDIQRAQSAVLVTRGGVEYAIVADDNHNFDDPYWRAMFEAPMFVQLSPFGPPVAIGGSASAKRVAVGGKLGIVRDPFGLLGAPQFIGATLPLDGYGITNLSLSEDGRVLIGQLKGGYGTLDQFTQKPHQNHAWDVDALIEAALAAPEQDRLVKHIALPAGAEQLISGVGTTPAGTAFEHTGLVITDSNYIDDDGVIFLVDDQRPEPVTPPEPGPIVTAPGGAGGASSTSSAGSPNALPSTYNPATGEITIRNTGATAINVDVVVSENPFLQWNNPPTGAPVAIGRAGVQTILQNQQIAAGASIVIRVTSKLSDEFIAAFTQADAFLGLATVKIFERTGTTLSATPTSTESVVYLADLTDGVRDLTLGFLPTVENQAGRKLRIYNPQHLDLKLKDLDTDRFNAPVYDEATKTTTIALKASAARTAAYTSNLEIRLVADQPDHPTQPLIRNLKVSASVTPKQRLVIDFAKIKADLMSYQAQAIAWKIAHPQTGTPPPGTPAAAWDERGLTVDTNIKGQGPLGYGGMYRSFLAELGTSVWNEAQWTVFQTKITEAFRAIFAPFVNDGSFDWRYGTNVPSVSHFDYVSKTYRYVQLNQTESTIAGRDDIANGWATLDLDRGSSGLGKLVTSAPAAAPLRTDLSPSEQRSIFYGSLNRIPNDVGTVVLDAFLRRTNTGPLATRTVEKYGEDLGWLLAHEFSHTLGLLDEYNADPNLPNVPGSTARVASYMKFYGNLELQDFHRVQLRAAFHDTSTSSEALDDLRTMKNLVAKYIELARATRQFTLSPTELGDLETLSRALALADASRLDATVPSAVYSGAVASAEGRPAGAESADGSAVDFDGSEATLVESPLEQVHLTEHLSLDAGDRYLSFTVDARGLVRNGSGASSGPADAFEVALLDAATGLPLAGTVALSHADSLLNRQADGTERVAASVKRVVNADGSATYFIDLSSIAARTAALLSFDLLGFGAAESQVTVRDVRTVHDLRANDDSLVGDEDASIAGNVLDNDLLLGGAVGSLQVLDGPTHGEVVVANDGSFSFRPAADYFGGDSFTYRFVDDQTRISNVATVRLTIRPVNDAPTARADFAASVRAGELFTFDPLAGATDVEGATLAPVVVVAPAHGVIERNSDGSYSYAPRRSYVGTDVFSYRVGDGELFSPTVTVSFDVLAATSAPVARDQTLRTMEDEALSIDPGALGIGTQGEDVVGVVTSSPAHGTLTIGADGRWTYLPSFDFNGADFLRYHLIVGGVMSNEATLTLQVSAVNDAPTLAEQSVTVLEDGQSIIDPFTTARDVDGDVLTAEIVIAPRHGSLLVAADGKLIYRPAENYYGADSFTYRVNDGRLLSAVASVALTVESVNDAPTARDGALSLAENGSLIVDLRSFGFDPEGQPLRAVVTVAPTHGVLNASGDGRFTYRPDANFHGTDSLRFQLDDGDLHSAEANLALTVVPAGASVPAAADSLITGVEDTALVLRYADFNVTGGAGPLSIVFAALPAEGILQRRLANGSWASLTAGTSISRTDLDAGQLRFVPSPDASGGPGYAAPGDGNRHAHYASIAFTAFDGVQSSAVAHVVIDIAAVADSPRLHWSDTGARTSEDSAVLLPSVEAGLSDEDGSESLVLTLTGLPIGAVLTDGVNRFVSSPDHLTLSLVGWNVAALQLAPPADFNGRIELQLQATAIEVSTGTRATTTQTIAIVVDAVADDPQLTLLVRSVDVSRAIVATSWEASANPTTAATIVGAATLEGWSVIAARADRLSAFEIWASGDRMRNAAGNNTTVRADADDGAQWLGLTNGLKVSYQTLGVQRSIDTVDGALYTLTLDYAGGLGLDAADTRIGIYLDGQRIATYAGTSGMTALNWQALSFQFGGNGLARSLAVRLEGGDGLLTVRAAMIDDLRIVETLPQGAAEVWGLANTPVPLPRVQAEAKSTGEQLRVEVLGLLRDWILSDGAHSVVITARGQAVDVTSWDLQRLSVAAPAAFVGALPITVRATSLEPSNGSTASVQREVTVHVLPGVAVATPPGANPFVSMAAAAELASTPARSNPAGGLGLGSISTPELSARGQLSFTALSVTRSRSSDEDDEGDAARAHALTDAWLVELERSAQEQWRRLIATEA